MASFLSICLNPTLQKTLRFPQIQPNRVNRTATYRLDASGKGVNVSRVLQQLGQSVIHLTQLGGNLRPLFLELCEQDHLDVRWVESNSPIRFCYTVIEESTHTVTELVEESETVGPETEENIKALFAQILESEFFSSPLDGDLKKQKNAPPTLIISGTKARGFSADIFPFMVQRAREQDMRVILDIRGEDLLRCLPYHPDVIKPNFDEFVETFMPEQTTFHTARSPSLLVTPDGTSLEPLPLLVQKKALEIQKRYGCQIILTRGSQSLWAFYEGKFIEQKIEPILPVNTTGCGDAFTAGIAAAFATGASLQEALQEGIRCGALNAATLKPGSIVAES
ncbi:MAG: PfkB family carbohydrate kinase [Treponemataceae bacterium]|nr:PfkB family carbohydrate kinase [Treponemataceae bacterium]